MNKWNIYKFHFKKIVFTPYFWILCALSLLSAIGGIVASNIVKSNVLTPKPVVKQICYINKTNLDLTRLNQLLKARNQELVLKSQCQDLKIENNNKNYVITSNQDAEFNTNLIASLQQIHLQEFKQKTNFKELPITIKTKNNVNNQALNLPAMFVGIVITVLSFITIMYLITIVFRHVAFERTNKIWEMTLNKIDPMFLFFTKITAVIFLIGVPLMFGIILNIILTKFNLITIYEQIKLPKFDNSFLIFYGFEFLITLVIFSLISGYVALYVKSVEQIQSMVGWSASIALVSYILALASVQMPFSLIKYISFINPFSTMFSLFDSFNNINNHQMLILLPISLQILIIVIMRLLIIKKFKKL